MATGATTAVPAALPLGRLRELIFPIAIVASVLVILVPLPPALMDIALAVNITVAVIVLLTTIYVRTPLEFSVFPSLLLATTLARLVLNVATTRLILTRADTHGELAAGGVVNSFAHFVAGEGNLVVGLIIFIIIVVIQFVVITKGATRISEVAARFALDGMPGRQMAIDADLNAGIIDEKEAQGRREEISRQADFFGAMDGASKFVRGDAIAGIVILVINIVGGLIIGMVEYGMGFAEAAKLFTRLTIGDGLVSQVPAFLISLAAGLLTTRSSKATDLPAEFLRQLFSRPQALAIASGFVAILIFTSLPTVPLLLIGGSCAGLSVALSRRERDAQAAVTAQAKAVADKPPDERVEDYLVTDPMEVEIGVGLIRLADPKRGGDLLDRVSRVRQNIASDIGIIMPKVRIRDNMRLDQNNYRIKIADMPVAEATVYPNMMLAMDSGVTTGKISGIATTEPAFGTPATWIEPQARDQAEMHGYTVVEPVAVLATHLTEVVRRYADELLTRDAVKHLIDELKTASPAVVEELIPGQMKLVDVQQILQRLLREQAPIRQLSVILEALGEYASRTKDPVLLTEYVRHRLARAISTRYRDKQNRMHVVTIDPAMEDRIRAGIEHSERGLFVRMSPAVVEKTCAAIAAEIEKLTRAHHPPVVLVSPQIRAGLKQLTETHLPKLVVLSFNELTRDTHIESVGLISDGYKSMQDENDMEVKTYRAKSMQQALDMVRRDLGPDAAVLHTRAVRGGLLRWFVGGRRIEVTASAGVHVPSRLAAPSTAAPASMGAATFDYSSREADVPPHRTHDHLPDYRAMFRDDVKGQLDDLYSMVEELCTRSKKSSGPDMPESLFKLFTDLIEAEVGEDLARELVQRVRTESPGEEVDDPILAKARIARMIEDQIHTTGPIQATPGKCRLIALVGPTGVGKTTTIAKLAANYSLREKCRVGLITVDTYRIAAVEQMRTYADIMDLPMEVVATPREMREAAKRLAELDLVFMDTAGRSPHDDVRIQELKSVLAEAQPDEVHLVLSSVAAAKSLAKTARLFAPVGTTAMILTKLDEAAGLGNLLPLLHESNLPLSYLTDGQNVPDDIQIADRRRLARIVLGMET